MRRMNAAEKLWRMVCDSRGEVLPKILSMLEVSEKATEAVASARTVCSSSSSSSSAPSDPAAASPSKVQNAVEGRSTRGGRAALGSGTRKRKQHQGRGGDSMRPPHQPKQSRGSGNKKGVTGSASSTAVMRQPFSGFNALIEAAAVVPPTVHDRQLASISRSADNVMSRSTQGGNYDPHSFYGMTVNGGYGTTPSYVHVRDVPGQRELYNSLSRPAHYRHYL